MSSSFSISRRAFAIVAALSATASAQASNQQQSRQTGQQAPPAVTPAQKALREIRLHPAAPVSPHSQELVRIARTAQAKRELEGELYEQHLANLIANRPADVKDIQAFSSLSTQARALARNEVAARPDRLNDKIDQIAPVPIGGAAWQETLIIGFATYLVNRAKAEVMHSVATNVGKKLCDDIKQSANPSRQLLPATCASISSPTESPPAWATVRTAVAKDIRTLPESLLARYAAIDDARKEYRAEVVRYVVVGLQITRLLERGDDPVWIAAGLANQFRCPKDKAECAPEAMAAFFHGLSQAVKLIGRDPTIADDPVALSKAVEAWIEEVAHIYGRPNLNTEEHLKVIAAALRDINAGVNALRLLEAQLRAKPDDFGTYARYVGTTWHMVGSASQLVPERYRFALQERIDSADAIVGPALAAYDRIRAKDFAGAYVELYSIARRAFPAAMPRVFTTYGPFLAQLATANTPEAVEQTLSAAAPVASYRDKRGNRKMSLTLNAYGGGQRGWEETAAQPDSRRNEVGVFAPVGFEASWGIGGKPKQSLGLLFTVVDLGALISYRSGSEQQLVADPAKVIETDTEIGFKQVMSPGVYLTYGVAQSFPLVLGVGVSLHPDLRNVRNTAVATAPRDPTAARRLALFAALDMPIFRF